MHRASELEITMPERASENSVRRRHKPTTRQGHHEDSDCANHAANYHNAIGSDPLSERADDWSKHNNQNGVDPGKLSNRRVQSHFAIPELWKYVIELEKNGFEEADEQKKNQEPIKSRLADQLSEKNEGVGGAFADSSRNPG